MDSATPGVSGIVVGGQTKFALDKNTASFLFVAVSMVTNMARAKFDAMSS